MAKMLRYQLILFLSILVLGVVGGCAYQREIPEEDVFGEDISKKLIEPGIVDAEKLEIVWQTKLPMKGSESLERLIVIDNRIYALSDRNYMVSLERGSGDVIFSRFIGQASLPVLGLEVYRDVLFTVVGNQLIEINPEIGSELRSERLPVRAICPVGRNRWFFYIGGADRRVHTLRADNMVGVFDVAAENDSMITSVAADERFFIFATDRGNCISVKSDQALRLWQFDAADAIAGPIVMDAESVFFASRDTHIYRISLFRGEFEWKYHTGAALKKGPRVTDDVVYQYVGDGGLVAIDKESGEFMWRLAEGADLLSEAGGRAYVITKAGALVVMDNKTEERIYSVEFAGVSKYAVNLEDSKIYIGDDAGRVSCIKPIE